MVRGRRDQADGLGGNWRRRAISSDTLWAGSWPPSPGLEAWAILIWSSSVGGRGTGVTPGKRPDGDLLDARVLVVAALAPGEAVGSLAASPQLDLPR